MPSLCPSRKTETIRKNFDEWYEKEFHGKCTYFAFGGYLSVTENGDLIPCFYTDLQPSEPMMLGNIRDKSLTTAWEEIKASKYYRRFQDRNVLKGKCGVCEYREICGGCRNRAYAYTGDITNLTLHAFTFLRAFAKNNFS